jgi:hypothetical protein
MMTSVSKCSAVIDGRYVHYTNMTLTEENEWRAELDRQQAQKAPLQVTRRQTARRSGQPSRRVNYAAQAIGRAMFETVVRVNGKADDIPFDGELVDSPVYLHQADEYGVA